MSGRPLALHPDATALPGVPPCALGTPAAESLTGYLQRVAAAHVVPSAVVFDRLVLSAARDEGLWPRLALSRVLNGPARELDGATRAAEVGVQAMSAAAGRSDLAQATLLGLRSLGLVRLDALLTEHKRWCVRCWRADEARGEPLYERKLWTLLVVDACPEHAVVLMDRCPVCGRRQPPIAPDVKVGVCARCGWELCAEPVALDSVERGDAERRLWYSRDAAALVHAADVVAMFGVSQDALSQARAEALDALHAQVSDCEETRGISRLVGQWRQRWRAVPLEELFSVLWRARWPIVRFFPSRVRDLVGGMYC